MGWTKHVVSAVWPRWYHYLPHSDHRLIYQLSDYEKVLRGPSSSPTPSERSRLEASSDEDWSRRRKLLDEASDREEVEQESVEMQREAKALDKAMEDRILARKSSSSSVGSGIGMGSAWKSRYSARKRTGSIASVMTSNSMLSENLVEEDEEQELLGVGGGFDRSSARPSPLEAHLQSDGSSDGEFGTTQASPEAPPSAPSTSTRFSFKLPPVPATAFKPTFDTSRRSISKTRRRPTPLDILPTVPDSPVNVATTPTVLAIPRSRKESRATFPLSHVRKPSQPAQPTQNAHKPALQTPSQTLFVFPPSPTFSTCTPSAMTLTSNSVSVPFPCTATPRSRSDSRRRSLIGLMVPSTPTTAHARVDARGWVGIH
jgi:tyrosine-protein phosphatase